jgi:hypothetical protein
MGGARLRRCRCSHAGGRQNLLPLFPTELVQNLLGQRSGYADKGAMTIVPSAPVMPPQPKISTRGLNFYYGSTQALEIDFGAAL